MKLGLIGLPLTGKTTCFNLLTNIAGELSDFSSGKVAANIGVAKIPDARIDFLTEMYRPEKTILATIEVTDIKGIISDSSGKDSTAAKFLESVRPLYSLVHVVRAFKNNNVIHAEGSINPLRDIETISMELLFADLAIIEGRIQRIESGKKVTSENLKELEVLKKCREGLENERLINSIGLTEDESQHLKSYNFLTERPLILLVNLDEDQFKSGKYDKKEQVMKYASDKHIPAVEISAKNELEINTLEEEDKKLFMEDLGITETGINRLSTAVYDYLGLISFFTVGEDEVRAWPIKKGISVKVAAGKIHSDIERGFIRAEVVKYADLKALGSMQSVKQKGLFKLESKEYIVKDGDIINFRFNV